MLEYVREEQPSRLLSRGFIFCGDEMCHFAKSIHHNCRNPTLAKCWGAAQQLEKLEVWSPSGLSNVQSSTSRPKTPRIGVFLKSLKSS